MSGSRRGLFLLNVMTIPKNQFCGEDELFEELAALLRPALFRASDGACCRGRFLTLHIYPATPFNEKPLLDLLVERALAGGRRESIGPPRSLSLALDLMQDAGERPVRAADRVRARRTLARVLADRDCSEAQRDEAAAALARLNQPRVSGLLMARLKLLVGIARDGMQEVLVATLDEAGHGSVSGVPPDAECWVRPRRGAALAFEIAERTRREVLVPEEEPDVQVEADDWTLRLEPASAERGASNIRVRLATAPELAFPGGEFAVVAYPEHGEGRWHVAGLTAAGDGMLMGLRRGRYQLAVALGPLPPAARALSTGLSVRTQLRQQRGVARLEVETDDPALGTSRCVCLREQPAGDAVLLGGAELRGTPISGGWRGRARTAFATVAAGDGESKKDVRTRTAARAGRWAGASQPTGEEPPVCFVLL